MPNLISLKCPNCGANQGISTQTTTFACGYCGAQQIVDRTGDTVSLELVTDAIRLVQRGTDKTAAELALRRLNEEYAGIQFQYQQNLNQKFYARRANKTRYKNIGIGISVFCFFAVFAGGWISVGTGLVWLTAVIVIVTYYNRDDQRIKSDFGAANRQLQFYANGVQAQIEQQRRIVDS